MEEVKEISVVHQRLSLLCKTLHVSESQFSTKIGKSRSYIASLKKDITSEVLMNISIAFPTTNLLWLITGEGEILITENSNKPTGGSSLTKFILEENKKLHDRIENLLVENTELKEKIKSLQEDVQVENTAECVTAKRLA